jgi:two-component system CheB/CheR fusion protein
VSEAEVDQDFEELLSFLKNNRGFDFTGYKRTTLARRVGHRMQAMSIATYGEYLDYLELHQDEYTSLFDTVLINVTGFFRDQGSWETLRTMIIPDLVQQKAPNRPIRIWSAGCASGEEAYTLAILFAEELGVDEFRERVKIYATDVDEEALQVARVASYDEQAASSVPEELRERYFERLGARHVFRRDLRRSVIFGRNDLTQDAPISRCDLLVSRNTLMYFNAETQGRILGRFHFAVNNTGYLFLGKAEMLLNRGELFVPVDLRRRIFRKVLTRAARDAQDVVTDGDPAVPYPTQERVQVAALATSPVAQLAVDPQGVLMAANSRAETLFSIHPRDIGRPFRDLEVSYRPIELRSKIEQVTRERRPLELQDIEWQRASGVAPVFFNVLLTPLFDRRAGLIGVGIAFTDVTRYRQLREELEHANQDLERAYEELQSTNEELETTNEELQSTNEELETTNEELQSTVEELETMNEELQSTNDELQDINQELRTRSAELDRVNAFLESVLTSLGNAVVVVDVGQIVQAWSPGAEELWGLRADEVLGLHFLTLDIGLPVHEVGPTLRTLVSDGHAGRERVVLDAVNRRGRSLKIQVTASPLLDPEGEATGAILMMEPTEPEPGTVDTAG